MTKLDLIQMENLQGMKNDNSVCSYLTGGFCVATIGLAASTVFAPLAGATGIGCLAGFLSGCHK